MTKKITRDICLVIARKLLAKGDQQFDLLRKLLVDQLEDLIPRNNHFQPIECVLDPVIKPMGIKIAQEALRTVLERHHTETLKTYGTDPLLFVTERRRRPEEYYIR